MTSLRVMWVGWFAISFGSAACQAVDNIVFLNNGPTELRLYLSNADGTGERPLSEPGARDYNPAWSASGEWIAFTSERAGSADIYRMHPDGTAVEQLTDNLAFDDQAAFSPDSTRIVFVSTRATGHANLWVLDIATHKTTSLTTGDGGDFRPAWSPDGQWIAFSSDRGSELPPATGRWERLQLADLYIVHPDGTGLRRLSEHGGFCGSPKWLRESKGVLAACMTAQETWEFRTPQTPSDAENQIVMFDIATGRKSMVTTGTGIKIAPTVTPNEGVAYVHYAGMKVEVVGSVHGPAGDHLSRRPVAWSPDGKHVVYGREFTKIPTEPSKRWGRNPSFSLNVTFFLPAYDPTGEHLAVTSPGADGTTLFVVDEGKPGKAILARKDVILAPSWSPDGKQMVVGIGGFSAFLDFALGGRKPSDPVNGGAQVAILNSDGTGLEMLTTGTNNNAFASFSPDGTHIVYRTAGPTDEGLRIMNLKDRSITALTGAYDNFPVWSPKGDLIAFIRKIDGSFQAMTIRPDGKELKQLTHTKGNEAHLAWSPDGERLLVTSSRMGFKDETLYTTAPQPYGEIFVMRYDGTQVEQLTDDQWEEGGPAWQPHRVVAAK